ARRQPSLGLEPVGATQAGGRVGRGRVEDRRLAPRLAARRRVRRALDERVVEARAELLADLPRREARQQGVLGMLRGGVGQHREARDRLPRLFGAVRGRKLAYHARDGDEIALDEWFVVRSWSFVEPQPTTNYER